MIEVDTNRKVTIINEVQEEIHEEIPKLIINWIQYMSMHDKKD